MQASEWADYWNYTGTSLAWGLFYRGLGMIYLVSFLSLYHQIPGLNKIFPVDRLFRRINKDFPPKRKFFYFPTLVWLLKPSTSSLRLICLLGILNSTLVVIGMAKLSIIPLFLSWFMFLSLATTMGEFVCFPWDYLLLESTFISLLGLPDLPFLGVGSRSLHPGLLGWMLRFCLFRLMHGNGQILGRLVDGAAVYSGFFDLAAPPHPIRPFSCLQSANDHPQNFSSSRLFN